MQRKQKALPQGWEEHRIEELSLRIRGGDDEVTEKLETDDSGEIAVIFSGDLKNTSEVKIHKRITQETLRSALKDAAIKDILKNKPPQTDTQSQVTDAQLRKIDARIQTTIPLMLLPEEVTILVALARSKAGAVGTYTQGNAVVNRAIMAITPDPEKILPDLLFYYFKNLVFQSSIQEKLMPGQKTYAPIGDIRKMLVSIPGEIPRQEQLLQRIEALLSGVKSAQDILQKNQNLMDHLLESALREVFISERMSKWETGKLSDQVDIQSGEEELQQNKYERYPFVNADDIDATVEQLMIDRSRMGSDLPTPAQGFILEHKPECLLYANIFTSDTHWRGRVAMPYYKSAASPEMLRCNSDLFALTIRSPTQLQPRFLFWALQVPGFIAMLQDHRQTQTRLKITEDQLQKSSLLFPKEHEEQERISTYLDAFQERLARMKESHDASRLMIDQMESSILDRAFRGEI